jgi:hypothetical protein
MRNIIYLLALAIPFMVATPFSAKAGCDAPYAGCLAACGNRVTGGTSGGSAGTLNAECKVKCQVAYRSCKCQASLKACLASAPNSYVQSRCRWRYRC